MVRLQYDGHYKDYDIFILVKGLEELEENMQRRIQEKNIEGIQDDHTIAKRIRDHLYKKYYDMSKLDVEIISEAARQLCIRADRLLRVWGNIGY